MTGILLCSGTPLVQSLLGQGGWINEAVNMEITGCLIPSGHKRVVETTSQSYQHCGCVAVFHCSVKPVLSRHPEGMVG